MKIGIVCPYNIAYGGGVQTLVSALQAEFTKRGHKAYIITPEPKEYDPAIVKQKNIIFIGSSSDFRSPTHTTIQVSAGLNEQIDRVLDKYKFDVIHFHEPWVPVLGRQIITRSQSANVATTHATLPDTRMTRTVVKMVTPYARSVFKYIDAFTAVSPPACEYLNSLGVEDISIVPNGIELSNFKKQAKLNPGHKTKEILYIGRLEHRKGVSYLIEAMAELVKRRSDVKLTVAGQGPDRAKLEQLTVDLELTDKIDFLGYISDKEKFKRLSEADLYCSPAIFGESQGIVLLESMASGLVTVAGNNPGYASVLTGVGSLSLVNPKDAEQFAHRLELLIYEPDLRQLWRDWAKENIKQYDYKHIADLYERVYRDVLSRPKLRYQEIEDALARKRARKMVSRRSRYTKV